MRESWEEGEAPEEGERVNLWLSHTVVVWVEEGGVEGVPLGGLVGVTIELKAGVMESEVVMVD